MHNESHRERESVRARVHSVHRHTLKWTHTPTSVLLLLRSPVDRPGVLVLEVLEVQEECSMQLAHCELHEPPGRGHQRSSPVCEERARTLVLFNRETAAQLMPAPGDIVHIYPPWWEDAVRVALKCDLFGHKCDLLIITSPGCLTPTVQNDACANFYSAVETCSAHAQTVCICRVDITQKTYYKLYRAKYRSKN